MENKPISKTLLAVNGLLVLAVIGMVFFIDEALQKHVQVATTHTPQAVSAPTHAFDAVSLQGKSAYVYDVAENKILYQKNADVQLPLASLTKLMMALVAIDSVPANSHITLSKDFFTDTEDGTNGLVAGETWTMKNLLDFSLVVSSNDGATSLASVIGATLSHTTDYNIGRADFIAKMNQTAQTLGLSQTYFINENGLDVSGTISGGYGSAHNVAQLMQYIITQKPSLLEATTYPVATVSSFSQNHVAQNTDTLIPNIPGLLASKTGYTSLAGGNLAVAFDAGLEHPIVIVVLGSTQDGRFTDVSQLVKASLVYVRE